MPRQALGFAHYRLHLLDTGIFASLTEIAAAEDIDLGQVSRIARLARLAPWVVEAGLAAEVEGILRNGAPLNWQKQNWV